MDNAKKNTTARFNIILSMAIFGSIGIVRRYLPLSSGLIAFCRGVTGTLFLMLYVKLRGRRLFHGIGMKKTLLLAVSGAVMGLNWIFLFEAYNETTVQIATLCYYMEPVIVILASALLFKERLTRRKAVCAALAFAGMVLVSGVLEGGTASAGQMKGIIYGLIAALLYSTVVLMNKQLPGIDPFEKTVIQLAASAAVMVPYLLLTEDFAAIAWSPQTALLLLLAGIVHTGITYALYFGSIDSLKAQTIALLSYIDPITALLLSALILHESLSIAGIAGAVLILGSAIAAEGGLPSVKSRKEKSE